MHCSSFPTHAAYWIKSNSIYLRAKINSPKDDAAILAIVQNFLANFEGTGAVGARFSRATATVYAPVATEQSTVNLLVEMKGLAE